MKKFVFLGAVFWGLLGFGLQVMPEPKPGEVRVFLTILTEVREAGGTRVLAHMLFINNSKKEARIAPFLVGVDGGEPSGAFFTVLANGHELPYQGPIPKRAPPNDKDFVVLKPRQKIGGRFDLTEAYPWLKGPATYSFSFETDNYFSQFPTRLKSNKFKLKMTVATTTSN